MPPHIHTLTVDGSVDLARQVTGVGIVVQESVRADRRGRIVEMIAESHVYCRDVSCEALAIPFCGVSSTRDHPLCQRRVRQRLLELYVPMGGEWT